MSEAYILLGGNLGNRTGSLKKAIDLIPGKEVKITGRSSIYETEPWGFEHNLYFLNLVLKIETSLKPLELLERIIGIERNMGRDKINTSYSARIIDIDILFYDDIIIKTNKLIIPHPKINERKFVLIPMAEIAPEFIHPVLKKSISRLRDECADKKQVKRFNQETD
jgi:2-amino-4-hydroxy-6-hydroxymethyldihydropteridine diphosphokinase